MPYLITFNAVNPLHMMKFICILSTVFLFSCKTTTWFVVRHAEKETATMSPDVPLSAAGSQRAQALKDMLKDKGIHHIYSTNFIRTKSTAQPLAEATANSIEIYNPADTGFVSGLKSRSDGNFLIVGHSNTVDDIVNRLAGTKEIAGDLPDSQYGDLFVIRRKGKTISFEKKHFGN